MQRKQKALLNLDFPNKRFLFEKDGLLFQKFVKLNSCKLEDTIVSTLIRLDAFIIKVIDSLIQSIVEAKYIFRPHN